MGFYHSKSKLPLRGRKKLPLRGRKFRRLQLLKDYQPERVYTFVPMRQLDNVPDELLLWDSDDVPDQETLYGHA